MTTEKVNLLTNLLKNGNIFTTSSIDLLANICYNKGMQNPQYDHHQSLASTLINKVWQLVRFLVVTGVIFATSFLIMNFSAYKQIFISMINPEAQAQAAEVLEKASGQDVDIQAETAKLLPVLPTKKVNIKRFDWPEMPVASTDYRLVIPKLAKNVPLVQMSSENLHGEDWHELEKQIQNGLKEGVVHYPGTPQPGQFGNVFLTGHSSFYSWDEGRFKDVFALLEKLDKGDEFIVWHQQKKYVYRIYDKLVVNPNNVGVLEQPTDRKIATLMTCTPVGTTLNRLIIRAEDITDQPIG